MFIAFSGTNTHLLVLCQGVWHKNKAGANAPVHNAIGAGQTSKRLVTCRIFSGRLPSAALLHLGISAALEIAGARAEVFAVLDQGAILIGLLTKHFVDAAFLPVEGNVIPAYLPEIADRPVPPVGRTIERFFWRGRGLQFYGIAPSWIHESRRADETGTWQPSSALHDCNRAHRKHFQPVPLLSMGRDRMLPHANCTKGRPFRLHFFGMSTAINESQKQKESSSHESLA